MKQVATFGLVVLLIECICSQPTVKIPKLGSIRGTEMKSFKGQTFYSFEGVPYAQPPVGDLRFEEPKPVKPWIGIWEASVIYKCLQKFQFSKSNNDLFIGEEDCLYLNIYTPSIKKGANLSVVVFIHGGAYMFSWGGATRPEYILDKNVIYVSLNYRLGPFVPGNNGFKDQILALRWIQDNIGYFGGNPNSVTIMGMSAGGASIHFHFLSKKSHNLFQRGISQSGTLLDSWAIGEKPLEKAQVLSNSLGCSTNNTKDMVTCLKNRSGTQIVHAINQLQPWLYNPFSPFAPVIDSWAEDPILPQHPIQLIKNGSLADKPWMCSYTSAEGWYPGDDFYQQRYLDNLNTRWNELLPFILHYNDTVSLGEKDSVSNAIRKYYLKNKKLTFRNYMKFIELMSDRLFVHDIEKTIRYHAQVVTSPIYVYYFAYPLTHQKNQGASHADDMKSIFGPMVEEKCANLEVMELMTELVASFIKTGQPNVPLQWPPISKNDLKSFVHLEIWNGRKVFVEKESRYKNGNFWEKLPFQENENLLA